MKPWLRYHVLGRFHCNYLMNCSVVFGCLERGSTGLCNISAVCWKLAQCRTWPIQAMTNATIQNQMCTWCPRSVAVAQIEFSRLSNRQSDGLYSRGSLQNEADQRYRTQERDTLFRTPQAAIYVPILHAQRLASSLYQQCWLSE